MKILEEFEIKSIFSKPDFTEEERYYFFSLNRVEADLLKSFRSVKSKTYFILQLGYFKDKHQFFKLDYANIKDDLEYILSYHFTTRDSAKNLGSLSNKTVLKQQQLIRNLFGFRSFGLQERQQVTDKANEAVTFCSKPIFVFKEILNFLIEEKIILPRYTTMQDLIGKSISFEQNRLIDLLKEHLSFENKILLQQLLKNPQGLYEITHLKREPKDFSFTEIKLEINRGMQLKEIYQISEILLPRLGISNESIKYQASLVEYYSVFQLKQFDEWLSMLYLLCYTFHRYQKVNDNLINTFIYTVRRYKNEAKSIAKQQAYEHYTENNTNIKKAGEVLKLFTDDSISPTTPFHEIQHKVFNILDRIHLEQLAEEIVTDTTVDEQALHWAHIDKMAHRFKRYLRPIFIILEFTAPPSVLDPLSEAIQFLKETFSKGKSVNQVKIDKVPTQFIPEKLKNYIYRSNSTKQMELVGDRYEFLVYQMLWNHLEGGRLFCHDSAHFRSFEEYLINDNQWEHKEQLIENIGLSVFSQSIQHHLVGLEKTLEQRIKDINVRIKSGDNQYIQINKNNRRWSLQKEPTDDSTINQSFLIS